MGKFEDDRFTQLFAIFKQSIKNLQIWVDLKEENKFIIFIYWNWSIKKKYKDRHP